MQGLSRVALETIVNIIPAGIVIIEKENGKVSYVNNRAVEILGFNPSGLSFEEYALNIAKARKLDDGPYSYEQLPLIKALLYGRITHNQEINIQRRNQSELTILTNASPLTDDKGEITGALAIFEDITERKKLEEETQRLLKEVQQEKDRLSALISSITDEVWFADTQKKFILTNPTSPKEFLDKTDSSEKNVEKLTANIEVLRLDGSPRPDEESPSLRALKGEVVRNQEESVRNPANGKLRYRQVSASPVRDTNGNIIGAVSVTRDITELKQMQIKLEEYTKNLERLVEERTEKVCKSEQSYRELYESFDEAFIAADWELNVIHWNNAAERITKVPAKDALGKKVYDVLPEMNLVNIEPYLEALQARKPTRFMMNAVSRQTGKLSIFEISTYPSTLGIIIIVEDKTEEEQIKRFSTIGQVAGMVGHDIRNPLQSITNDIYLAKTDLASLSESKQKQSIKESLDEIEKTVEYVNKIVSDLQDYAKPIVPKIQEVDLKEIVQSTLSSMTIGESIQVEHYISEDFPKLKIDQSYVQRILQNLTTNAMQAMPCGGKLAIKASHKNGKAIISVEDTGEGIPLAIRDKLFIPLTTTKARGQGFGLPVVKRFTEALGGTVRFESEVGKGTKFILELPIEASQKSKET